ENKHLLGSFTLRLEQKLAREIVKSPLGGFSLIVRSRPVAAPIAHVRAKEIIRLRKPALSAFAQTFRFHRLRSSAKLFQNITSREALKLREGERGRETIKSAARGKVQLFIQRMILSWASDKTLTWFAPSIGKKSMKGKFWASSRPIRTGITSSFVPWKIAIFASGFRWRISTTPARLS